jgi:hypothetical protein
MWNLLFEEAQRMNQISVHCIFVRLKSEQKQVYTMVLRQRSV